jgi:hypothetical protein
VVAFVSFANRVPALLLNSVQNVTRVQAAIATPLEVSIVAFLLDAKVVPWIIEVLVTDTPKPTFPNENWPVDTKVVGLASSERGENMIDYYNQVETACNRKGL